MDSNETIKFIDEDSPEHFNYVWKKKKAVQKTIKEVQEEKDFRSICMENCNVQVIGFEENDLESRTYFGKEESSSGDDVPELVEDENEFSNNETSLSPRAPLVLEEDGENQNASLEIIVNESDHERFAMTSGLTVKDEEVEVEQSKVDAETIIKYGNGDQGGKATVDACRRVRFKDDVDQERKCDKKKDVPPLTEEGLEIDVLFTDDVTIRVSFKEGKVNVEESNSGEGVQCNVESEKGGSQLISDASKQIIHDDKKDAFSVKDLKRSDNPLLLEGENIPTENKCRCDLSPLQNVGIKILEYFEEENVLNESQCSSVSCHVPDYLDIKTTYDNKEEESVEVQSALEVGDGADCKKDCYDRSSPIVENRELDLEQDVKPFEKNYDGNRFDDENNKLEHELRESEKCSGMENNTFLSPVKQINSFEPNENNIEVNDDSFKKSGHNFMENDSTNSKNEYLFFTNSFSLGDIVEESCSDFDNEDYTSSESTIFFEAIDSVESTGEQLVNNAVSSDSELRLYAKSNESEDSSNSDSSLEKCEIESSEKEMFRQKCNPIIDLLEMQKQEEIYETSLEILQEFRSCLIPGITSASNWISCCDSDGDELSLGVVEAEVEGGPGEGGRRECGRTVLRVSTDGAARRASGSAEMLSTYPPVPSQHAWKTTLPCVSDSDSESVQGDSLDTVIQVSAARVDREVQVDTQCNKCESQHHAEGPTEETEVREGAEDVNISGDESLEALDEVPVESDSVSVPYNNLSSSVSNSIVTTEVCDSIKESDNINGYCEVKQLSNEECEKESNNVGSPKVILKDLFSIKRSTNALENLPLIFPHARGLGVTNQFNKISSSPFKNFESDDKNTCGVYSNDKDRSSSADEVRDGFPENNSSEKKCDHDRTDLRIEGLFQFNVSAHHEGVTSFSVKDESEEDEMKQKKKQEDNKAAEEAASDSGLCNGYHRGVLKSALKRSSTKKSKKKNRVQFDESLNKFFDADYVILIREEPDDFDGDYDVGGCDCGEDFCYDECYEEDEDDDEECFQEPQSPRFDLCAAFEPPVEFVDQVTLSPPDGYKDGSHCCPHHHPRLRRPGESLVIRHC